VFRGTSKWSTLFSHKGLNQKETEKYSEIFAMHSKKQCETANTFSIKYKKYAVAMN